MSEKPEVPAGPRARDVEVDVLVIGSGAGLSAALSAHERGLDVLVVEKTPVVGGSTARSGGAYWIPANPALLRDGSHDTEAAGRRYLEAIVDEDVPRDRWEAFLEHGPATVEMLERTTPLEFFWAKGYADYHPENPGGSAAGRTCEPKPVNARLLGEERARLRSPAMAAPVPMPVTGADYKWMNLMVRTPLKSWPKIMGRVAQGVGGLALGKEYTAGGHGLAAGLFAGVVEAGIPVWTRTELQDLVREGEKVTGARLSQDGREVTVTARRGVVLAAGGYDHETPMREKFQGPSMDVDLSLGAEGNTGDAIQIGRAAGADLAFMDQAWWFPALAPVAEGAEPGVLLAERSLPGSFMVDETGTRFGNEAADYMTFGQDVMAQRAAGRPLESMWLVMDQAYRNSYVFAGGVFPRMPFPQAWYDAGIVVSADDPAALARAARLPVDVFEATLRRFNTDADLGIDSEFGRGNSAYDRYYGDPTNTPNPNLRPLTGKLHAARVVLADLGTCGGLKADAKGRVVRADDTPIDGLYAIGNTAGNVFGRTYPGAGATIAQGLVFGHIVAGELAAR